MADRYERTYIWNLEENVSERFERIAAAEAQVEAAAERLSGSLSRALNVGNLSADSGETMLKRRAELIREIQDQSNKLDRYFTDTAGKLHQRNESLTLAPYASPKAFEELSAAFARNIEESHSLTASYNQQDRVLTRLRETASRFATQGVPAWSVPARLPQGDMLDSLQRARAAMDEAFKADPISPWRTRVNEALASMSRASSEAFGSLMADMKHAGLNSHEFESAVHMLENRFESAMRPVRRLDGELLELAAVQESVSRRLERNYKLRDAGDTSPDIARQIRRDSDKYAGIEDDIAKKKVSLAELRSVFDSVGVSLKNFRDEWKPVEQVFAEVIATLRNMDPEVRRFNLAWSTLGQAGRGIVTETGSAYNAITHLEEAIQRAPEFLLKMQEALDATARKEREFAAEMERRATFGQDAFKTAGMAAAAQADLDLWVRRAEIAARERNRILATAQAETGRAALGEGAQAATRQSEADIAALMVHLEELKQSIREAFTAGSSGRPLQALIDSVHTLDREAFAALEHTRSALARLVEDAGKTDKLDTMFTRLEREATASGAAVATLGERIAAAQIKAAAEVERVSLAATRAHAQLELEARAAEQVEARRGTVGGSLTGQFTELTTQAQAAQRRVAELRAQIDAALAGGAGGGRAAKTFEALDLALDKEGRTIAEWVVRQRERLGTLEIRVNAADSVRALDSLAIQLKTLGETGARGMRGIDTDLNNIAEAARRAGPSVSAFERILQQLQRTGGANRNALQGVAAGLQAGAQLGQGNAAGAGMSAMQGLGLAMFGAATAADLVVVAVQSVIFKLGELVRGAREATGEIIAVAAKEEQYVATFTRLTGSMRQAVADIADTRKLSEEIPVPVDKLLEAQRRLQAAIPPGKAAMDQYGRSMHDLVAAIGDIATARPDLVITQVTAAIERLSVGAPFADRYVRLLGLSVEDLAKAGAQLNAQGTGLVGHTEVERLQNVTAVITALERKYGGVSKLQSQTLDGMQQEWANWVENMQRILGRDVLVSVRKGFAELMEMAKRPEVHEFIERLSADLGGLAHKILPVFEEVLAGFDAFIQGFNKADQAVIDARIGIGVLTGQISQAQADQIRKEIQLKLAGDAALGTYSQIDALQKSILGTMGEEPDAVDQTTLKVEALRDVLQNYQNELKGIRKYWDDLIQGDQDAITGLNDKITDLRAKTADAIKPLQEDMEKLRDHTEQLNTAYQKHLQQLQDEETILDRIYNKGKAQDERKRLVLDIARDKALATDRGSSEGRSAQLRLVDELRRLQDLDAQTAHETAKQSIEDRRKAAERGHQADLDTDKGKVESDQDKIKKAQSDADARIKGWETRIHELNDEIKGYRSSEKAELQGIEDKAQEVQDRMDELNDSLKTWSQTYQSGSRSAEESSVKVKNAAQLILDKFNELKGGAGTLMKAIRDALTTPDTIPDLFKNLDDLWTRLTNIGARDIPGLTKPYQPSPSKVPGGGSPSPPTTHPTHPAPGGVPRDTPATVQGVAYNTRAGGGGSVATIVVQGECPTCHKQTFRDEIALNAQYIARLVGGYVVGGA